MMIIELTSRVFASLKHIRSSKTSLSVLLISAIAVLWFGVSSSNNNKEEEIKPSRVSLSQTVRVSGKVQAAKEANLSFQGTGNISYIGVSIGDKVFQGKVLATLYSGDEQANLLQAKATLANAQATLDQLVRGARPEELAIKEQVVVSAKNTLESTYATIPDAVRNVDTSIADSIKTKLSPLFNQSGEIYTIAFSACDQVLQSSVEISRTNLEKRLSVFQKNASLVSMISSGETLDKSFEEAYQATIATNDFISKLSSLLLASCSVQNSSLDTYRTTLASVRTTMNAVFADISSKRAALTSAKNTLAQAERDLTLTKAGTDSTKISAQQALVSQAEASVLAAEARLGKTVVTAPFDGTITDVTLTKGETASAGKVVVSMMSTSAFEVEASIPEIDIAKIQKGNSVEITLDAYGSSVIFPATITRVDESAVFEGNVPKYKTIATFAEKDDRIKTGMTANVSIITKRVAGAIALPIRFVESLDANRGLVSVRKGEEVQEKEVVLGIRSDDGMIEIKSGLTEDDTVVAIQPGVRSAQKQTN